MCWINHRNHKALGKPLAAISVKMGPLPSSVPGPPTAPHQGHAATPLLATMTFLEYPMVASMERNTCPYSLRSQPQRGWEKGAIEKSLDPLNASGTSSAQGRAWGQ